MVSDPVGDLIIRLKNAQRAGLSSVLIPYSNFKQTIADQLKAAGFVKAVNKKGKKIKKYLEVELLYVNQEPRISEVKRISKPSRRVYSRSGQIKPVRQGRGLALYSTPRGILTDKEAREQKVGGEALFQIW